MKNCSIWRRRGICITLKVIDKSTNSIYHVKIIMILDKTIGTKQKKILNFNNEFKQNFKYHLAMFTNSDNATADQCVSFLN